MPPKKEQKEIVGEIKDMEFFTEITSEENKRLVVVDCYLEWCGECTAMKENFRQLWFGFEDPESRICFYKVEEKIIPEDIKVNLKHGPLTCKPRFLMFEGGELKQEIDGPDFAVMEAACNKFIPQLDD